LSPWYRAILRNLSLFSTFPRMRETLFVCKFTTCVCVITIEFQEDVHLSNSQVYDARQRCIMPLLVHAIRK
jgi:hypothetical protein